MGMDVEMRYAVQFKVDRSTYACAQLIAMVFIIDACCSS